MTVRHIGRLSSCDQVNRLRTCPMPKIIIDGSHTHLISLKITVSPRCEKKPKPMGETSMGLKEKKYLSLLNGANRPTPRPPFVIASSSGCDNVDNIRKIKIIN